MDVDSWQLCANELDQSTGKLSTFYTQCIARIFWCVVALLRWFLVANILSFRQ